MKWLAYCVWLVVWFIGHSLLFAPILANRAEFGALVVVSAGAINATVFALGFRFISRQFKTRQSQVDTTNLALPSSHRLAAWFHAANQSASSAREERQPARVLERPEPTSPADSPMLVADELAKLAALVEKGLLTNEEFTRQKTRLLGNSPLPTQLSQVLNQRDQLAAQLASSEKCKVWLIAHGCRVTQSSRDDSWVVLKPSGVTEFARSPAELKAIAVGFVVPT